MRIAVNLLPFRAQLAGAGRYTRNILRELLRADTQNDYCFFLTPNTAAHFEFQASNVVTVRVSLPESSAARIAYEQIVLPIELARSKPDVLFTPSVAIPLGWGGKRVTVIYDMIAEQRAVQKYPPLRKVYVRWMSRYAAQHSDAVITISENSRREIAQYARVPVEKIALAPPAPDPNLRPVREAETIKRVRETYRLPDRYVLYLGTLEAGKNLVRLIHAFADMKRAHPELEQQLVLAGAPGWGVRDLENEIQRSDAVGLHRIGFVPDDDLAALYSLADVFVYPSWYEGFGMPPLEAMACGTPVIVSHVSALPEVVGDAAILVSPDDVQGMAKAMARVLTDDTLRAQLATQGLLRAQQFHWDSSAQVVLESLYKVAQ